MNVYSDVASAFVQGDSLRHPGSPFLLTAGLVRRFVPCTGGRREPRAFSGDSPPPRPQRGSISILDLNSNVQMPSNHVRARDGGQRVSGGEPRPRHLERHGRGYVRGPLAQTDSIRVSIESLHLGNEGHCEVGPSTTTPSVVGRTITTNAMRVDSMNRGTTRDTTCVVFPPIVLQPTGAIRAIIQRALCLPGEICTPGAVCATPATTRPLAQLAPSSWERSACSPSSGQPSPAVIQPAGAPRTVLPGAICPLAQPAIYPPSSQANAHHSRRDLHARLNKCDSPPNVRFILLYHPFLFPLN